MAGPKIFRIRASLGLGTHEGLFLILLNRISIIPQKKDNESSLKRKASNFRECPFVNP